MSNDQAKNIIKNIGKSYANFPDKLFTQNFAYSKIEKDVFDAVNSYVLKFGYNSETKKLIEFIENTSDDYKQLIAFSAVKKISISSLTPPISFADNIFDATNIARPIPTTFLGKMSSTETKVEWYIIQEGGKIKFVKVDNLASLKAICKLCEELAKDAGYSALRAACIGATNNWLSSFATTPIKNITAPFTNAPISAAAKTEMNRIFAKYKSLTDYEDFTFVQFMSDFQAHHIIPTELIRDTDFQPLMHYFNNCGSNCFDFNGIENGIWLHTYKNGVGVHASHPAYTGRIKTLIQNEWDGIKNLPLTDSEKAQRLGNKLRAIVQDVKPNYIEAKCIKNNPSKVNDIFNP